jgi:hypothetical protein
MWRVSVEAAKEEGRGGIEADVVAVTKSRPTTKFPAGLSPFL